MGIMRETWTIIGTGIAVVAVMVSLHISMTGSIRGIDDRLRAVEGRTERMEVKLSRVEAIVERAHPPWVAEAPATELL